MAFQVGEEVEDEREGEDGEEADGELDELCREELGRRVVECVSPLLVEDGAGLEQGGDLGQAHDHEVEDGEEEDAASGEGPGGCLRCVEVEGARDEGLDDGHGDVCDGVGGVVCNGAGGPPQAQGELLRVVHQVEGAFAGVLLAVGGVGLAERLRGGRRVLPGLQGGLPGFEGRELGGAPPERLELARSVWHAALETRPGRSRVRVRHTGQELGAGLPGGPCEAQPLEVGHRAVGRPKVHLAARVQHAHMVKRLVDAL